MFRDALTGYSRCMSGTKSDRIDFFLSRRGSVATVAQEITDVLTANRYVVIVQDYDIPITSNFVEAIHEAIKSARDLIVLLTADYEAMYWTRKEFTSFEADRAQTADERRIIVLRCEDVPPRGLFAPYVYQDLFGITDPTERASRILAAAEGRSRALKPTPRTFFGVPPRPVGFIGRREELDRLDEILIGGKVAAVTQTEFTPVSGTQTGRIAIRGMGGVGKTTLAIEYAHRYRDLYSGVWWCRAETRASLLTALAAMAKDLGAWSEADTEKATKAASERPEKPVIEKAAEAGLRRLAEQRGTALLVYDNVPDPDEISNLLPASGARVLITSRFSDWRGFAEEVPLDVLNLEEAIAFLEWRADRADPAGAHMLAVTLDSLPLALDHAAATCRRLLMPFSDYATRVATMIEAAPRGASYPRSVSATFKLAIAEAVKQCPAAESMMAFLAQCPQGRIPLSLVEGALDDEAERQDALLALTEVSLIKDDPSLHGTAAVSVHRLVQTVARVHLKNAVQLAWTRLLVRLDNLYPDLPSEIHMPPTHTPEAWHVFRSQVRDTLEQVRHRLYSGMLDDAQIYYTNLNQEFPAALVDMIKEANRIIDQCSDALRL